jgi:hypothetical protein
MIAGGRTDDTGVSANVPDLPWRELAAAVLRHASKEENRADAAQLFIQLAQHYAWPPHYQEYFRLWEENGFHLTPVHFYLPIPDTRTLGDGVFERESELPGVDMNEAGQLELLRNVFPSFRDEFDRFSFEPTGVPHEFYFNNDLFSGTDALALYCMVRHFRPKRILEVGSGFSSRVSAAALLRNGDGATLTCIEPYPDSILTKGFPGLTRLIPNPVQRVGIDAFRELVRDDVLFIDTSHVVAIGSDVNYLFLEVMPRLNPGVIVHVHDIYFPTEYPRDWVMNERRFWTEQYLLQAFLAFNSEFEVLLCNNYLSRKHRQSMRETFRRSPWWGGGSLWMRRRG